MAGQKKTNPKTAVLKWEASSPITQDFTGGKTGNIHVKVADCIHVFEQKFGTDHRNSDTNSSREFGPSSVTSQVWITQHYVLFSLSTADFEDYSLKVSWSNEFRGKMSA